MIHTPCEAIVWEELPVLRKELVRSMIDNFGLSQKAASEKLGLTSAAVSQYFSGKRGKIDITNKEYLDEINKSAELIITRGDGIVVSEICRLCKFFVSKKLFPIGDKKK